MSNEYPPKETILELQEIDLKIFRDSKTIEDYWNNAHQSDYSYWTSSNNSYKGIAKGLLIPRNLKGKKILVIGPGGNGPELYGAREMGGIVSGLDVSEVARKKFERDFEMYSWENLKNNYDEVWIHLVVQHMSDETLNTSLLKLKSHLAKNGLIRIQFAVPFTPNTFVRNPELNSLNSCKSGSNIRGFDDINSLIQKLNFKYSRVKITSLFPEHNSAHLFIAIGTKHRLLRNYFGVFQMKKLQRTDKLHKGKVQQILKPLTRFLLGLLRRMKR
jgi:hypothetical protein